jgi:hypothetical protein
MFPSAEVEALACFALCAAGVFDHVPDLTIKDCRNPFRGSCERVTRNCVVEIGHPMAFHTPVQCHYRKTAPAYFLLTWQEALVAVTAHEGTHAKQFSVKNPFRAKADEVACEWAAFKALSSYRRKQFAFFEAFSRHANGDKNALDTMLSLSIEREAVLRG